MAKINWNILNFTLIITLGLLFIFGGSFVWKTINQNNFPNKEQPLVEIENTQKYFQGQVEYTEGQVEKRENENLGWLEAEKSEIIKQGNEIRTLADSRAILTFEDGSILRLDANTQISFQPKENAINIILNKGTVFNKVAKSETRKYSVDAGEFKVIALGTAFSVDKENDEVMVLESEVQILDSQENKLEKIQTGEKAQIKEKKAEKKKLSKEDTEKKFVAWNMEKDKLKYKEKEENKKEEKTETQSQISGITLTGEKSSKGVKLYWKSSNSSNGFKLVKSKEKNPVYPGDEYVYLSNGETRSYEWKITTGSKYYFRVCEYLENGKCGTYSNNLYLDTPGADEKDDSDSKLSLSAVKKDDYVKLTWSLSGRKAPNGFKIAKDTSKNPTYPEDDWKYLSDKDERSYKWEDDLKNGKTYYFRVCIYEGGKCKTYSNNAEIEF